MNAVPITVSDAELLAFIDGWAKLLEREDYDAAFTHTDHIPEMGWTPELLRDVIKAYGDADPKQRVTLDGRPTDITQRKEVIRWPTNASGFCGEIWYDLNIDGQATDLTATFRLHTTPTGVTVHLNDIHVM